MRSLLTPAGTPSAGTIRFWILLLLVASAALVVLAAMRMPAPYAWTSHSISESAAQGMPQAWVARLGFLCFGSAVLALSLARRAVWGRGALASHLVFAACMLATAAFSHKPWLAGVPADMFEDDLHTVTATGMGFAFAAGVLLRLVERLPRTRARMALDVLALVAATVLSPLGVAYPDLAGALQRAMFVVAYVWYGAEAMAPHLPGGAASRHGERRARHNPAP